MKYRIFNITLIILLAGCMSSADVSDQPPLGFPTADAGEDQTVEPGATVTLAGSGSDADGTIASYLWEETSDAGVDLLNPSTDTATFTAPDTEGVLTFRLTVRDNQGNAWDDSMKVTVEAVVTQTAQFVAAIPSLPYPLLDPYHEENIGEYVLVAVDYTKQPPAFIKEDEDRYALAEDEFLRMFDYHLIELQQDEGHEEISVYIQGQHDKEQKIEWRGVFVAVLDQRAQPFIDAHGEMFKAGRQIVDLSRWEEALGDTIQRLYLIVAAVPMQTYPTTMPYYYELEIIGAKPQ